MKIILYGKEENIKTLEGKVKNALDELGLQDFISVEKSQNEELKNALSIEKEPALIVEEESIDFKDTIFEGIVPEDEEIKSMFISIIGGGDTASCGSGGCGTCTDC